MNLPLFKFGVIQTYVSAIIQKQGYHSLSGTYITKNNDNLSVSRDPKTHASKGKNCPWCKDDLTIE